jgi:hypothetical protein
MFDDLEDPFGPPTGNALSRVLARARRRRAIRRNSAALIVVVAVAATAVGANALDSGKRAIHVAGPSTTQPAPTSTSASTPSPTSTTTTTSTTTSTTQPASELWTSSHLTITPRSLGQVVVGMTLPEAQIAAGLTFDGTGDGAFFPTTLPAGFPHLFVNAAVDDHVSCVGVESGNVTTFPQTVVTSEGFRLGDTVSQLLAVYGSRATYLPAPPSGIAPSPGYVVTEADGNLAFSVDITQTRIVAIKGGGADVTPSTCTG